MPSRRMDIDFRPPPAIDEPEGFDELPDWLQDEARTRWGNQSGIMERAEQNRRIRTINTIILSGIAAAMITSAADSITIRVVSMVLSAGMAWFLRRREAEELAFGLGLFATIGLPLFTGVLGKLGCDFESLVYMPYFIAAGGVGFLLGQYGRPHIGD